MDRTKLLLLNPAEYEHPADRIALEKLEGTPGLEKLVRYYYKLEVERTQRIIYTGSYLKVTDQNLPEIKQLLDEACNNLYVKEIPPLFIEQDPRMNAFAIGSYKPMVSLTSGLVHALTPEELLSIIGHEIGHIKSAHQLYKTMGNYIAHIGTQLGQATLGIGSMLSDALEISLLYWSRMAELTADRAGLLACQDIDAFINAEIKMSGFPSSNIDENLRKSFIQQAEEFKGFDFDGLDKMAKLLIVKDKTHPFTVMRVSEILKWVDSGQYDEIIEKHGKNIGELEIDCIKCGYRLDGDEIFCGECGSKISVR